MVKTPIELISWRNEKGWTQVEAADYYGVSLGTYNGWENGRGRIRLPKRERTEQFIMAQFYAAHLMQPTERNKPLPLNMYVLREWRRCYQMTEQDAGRFLGISPDQMRWYESGRGAMPEWMVRVVLYGADPETVRQDDPTAANAIRTATIDIEPATHQGPPPAANPLVGPDGYGLDVPDYLKNI